MRGTHHRRAPARRIRAPPYVIGAQPGLVTPENEAVLLFGTRGNRRVLLLQPALHLSGTLLISAAQRLLGGKTPARQIAPNAADSQADPVALLDQHPHRRAAPQGEGQAQGIWRTAADQRADLGFF